VSRPLWTTSPDKISPQLQILPKFCISHGDCYPTVVNHLTWQDILSITPDKFSSEMNFSTCQVPHSLRPWDSLWTSLLSIVPRNPDGEIRRCSQVRPLCDLDFPQHRRPALTTSQDRSWHPVAVYFVGRLLNDRQEQNPVIPRKKRGAPEAQ
jgi:hypothetical protein